MAWGANKTLRRASRSKKSLTAAGLKVNRENADSIRRLAQGWQERSFEYYDICGEAKYAGQFYSRMLAGVRLFAAETDENGDVVETSNPAAIAALERIQDPGGGRTGLLGSYGRLMFLVGEAVLFVSKDPDTEIEQWEMLSTDELKIQGSTYLRLKSPGLNAEEYKEAGQGDDDSFEPVADNEAVAYRLWKRHPRYSHLADSTMQGVLDLFEELVLLTRAVRSRARSRLAGSGMLFIDDRISPAPPEPTGDEDPMEDLFLAELTEAMTEPIADEGSASAVVPLLVRVPVPDGSSVDKMFKYLQIVDPTQLYPETGLRRECIERIAIGLDMPPEILLGMADANHWTGWMIDEQTWKGHGQPIAQQLCDDLTSAYFRPYLKSEGLGDWDKYLIGYDASAVINNPDLSKTAQDLWDQGAVGYKALRDAGGFDDEDAQTPEEHQEWLGIKLRDSSVALEGKIAEPPPSPFPNMNGKPPLDGQGDPVEEEDGEQTSANVKKSEPEAPPASEEEPVTASLVARVMGASDLAVLRAREVAGNRVRSYCNRDAEAQSEIDGIRAGQVCPRLGRERVRALGCPSERELISGARPLIADALRLFSLEPESASLVADSIEQHASRTLYQEVPTPLPRSFMNYVTGLMQSAARP